MFRVLTGSWITGW